MPMSRKASHSANIDQDLGTNEYTSEHSQNMIRQKSARVHSDPGREYRLFSAADSNLSLPGSVEKWDHDAAERLISRCEDLGRLHFFLKFNLENQDRRKYITQLIGPAPSGNSAPISHDQVWNRVYSKGLHWRRNWQQQLQKAFLRHIEACARTQGNLLEMNDAELKDFCRQQFIQADLSALFPFVKHIIDFGTILDPPRPLTNVRRMMYAFTLTAYFQYFKWIRNHLFPHRHTTGSARPQFTNGSKLVWAKARALGIALGEKQGFKELTIECWPRLATQSRTRQQKNSAVPAEEETLSDLEPDFEPMGCPLK